MSETRRFTAEDYEQAMTIFVAGNVWAMLQQAAESERVLSRDATIADLRAQLATVMQERDELRGHRHELSLIETSIGERGKTDCSTPTFIRVRNVLDELASVTAALEQAQKELTGLREQQAWTVKWLEGQNAVFTPGHSADWNSGYSTAIESMLRLARLRDSPSSGLREQQIPEGVK